jgi:predicted AlkP superfamily phosphohydrolase/phosphomutase
MVADVGWKKTRLYSNDDFFSIVINQVDENGLPRFETESDYEAFRDEIIDKLIALKSLADGTPLVDKVYRREELYHGNYVAEAPDIIIEWADVRLTQGIRCGDIVIQADAMEKSDLQKILTGEHRGKGVLFFKGDMFCQGKKLVGNSVLDIAPTVLYLAGLPVPQKIDGHVLLEAFDMDYQRQHPLEISDKPIDYLEQAQFDYSEAGQEEVWQRLQGLGYVE